MKTDNNLKFSVVVPIYNVEKYLEKSIDCLISGSFKNLEILLVNDGSTDSSGEICDRYAKKDSRIKVFHQQNQGPSGARNTAIENATGDYLVFLDSDDNFVEDCLVEISNILIKHPVEVVVNYVKAIFYDTGKVFYHRDSNLNKNEINGKTGDSVVTEFRKNNVSPCVYRYVVKRDFIIENNIMFAPGLLNEDPLWTATMLCYANSFYLNEKDYYIYNLRENSITTNPRNYKRYDDLLTICEKLYQLSNGKSEAKKLYIYNLTVMLLNDLLQHREYFPKEQAKQTEFWFDRNKELLKAVVVAQPIIAIVAKIIGAKNSMTFFADVVKYKNKLKKALSR